MVATVVAGLAADVVAVLHLATGVVVVLGGLLAWARPRMAGRVLAVHLPVAGAAAAVTATGSDCPLTDAELALRAAAGEAPYTGGFLGHYLVEPVVEPLLGRPAGPGVGTWLLLAAVVPNAVAYAGLGRRWLVRAAAAPGPASAGVVPLTCRLLRPRTTRCKRRPATTPGRGTGSRAA